MVKKLCFNGNSIVVTDERDLYNDIRKDYMEYAGVYTEKFSKQYDKNIYNFDQLAQYAYDIGSVVINDLVKNVIIPALMGVNIYDIDIETFINDYFIDYHTWDDDFGIVSDKYMEIVLRGEHLDEYRRARRLGRGRIIGGGFGLSSAAKGIVQAGAINAAFGVMHASFNGIAKLVSSGIDAQRKNAIFSNPETKEALVKGIFNEVFNSHYAIIDILIERSKCNANVKPSAVDKKRADAIFNNIKDKYLQIEKKQLGKLISELFELNPYNREYYLFALDQFCAYDARKNEIREIAKFFNVDISEYKSDFDIKIDKEELNKYRLYLPVEGVFYVKNRGVVFYGRIIKGMVSLMDIIKINCNKSSQVQGISIGDVLVDVAIKGDKVNILCKDFKSLDEVRGTTLVFIEK